MDDKEIRALLSVDRPGETPATDTRFADARQAAARDPELARWMREEESLDDMIAAKLAGQLVSADLRARLLEAKPPPQIEHRSWRREILLAAAAIVALAIIFGSWRGPFQPAASLADYRGEMTSFIKVAPSLELESNDLTQVHNFLQAAGAPAHFKIPTKLQALEPVGCRTLRFRGNLVALVCFKRVHGGLAHLFVVPRSALRHPPKAGKRIYVKDGDWMTAAWSDDDQEYLIMAKGDQAEIKKFLASS